jgi:hypothetical protein
LFINFDKFQGQVLQIRDKRIIFEHNL